MDLDLGLCPKPRQRDDIPLESHLVLAVSYATRQQLRCPLTSCRNPSSGYAAPKNIPAAVPPGKAGETALPLATEAKARKIRKDAQSGPKAHFAVPVLGVAPNAARFEGVGEIFKGGRGVADPAPLKRPFFGRAKKERPPGEGKTVRHHAVKSSTKNPTA